MIIPVLAVAAAGIGFGVGLASSSSGHQGAAGTTSTAPAATTLPARTTTAPATTTTTAPTSLVSVVACPTTYGVPGGEAGTELGQSLSLKLAPAVASQLDAYSNDQRTVTPILGPRGWQCRAAVGTDGSVGIDLYPPGQSVPSTGAPPAGPGVSAASDGACPGCVSATVSAFVAGAAQQLGYTDSGISCVARPPGESLDWIAGSATANPPLHDVVGYEDPSTPPTNGVVLFDYASGGTGGTASQESCVLPASEHQLCTAILDDFVERAWYMR